MGFFFTLLQIFVLYEILMLIFGHRWPISVGGGCGGQSIGGKKRFFPWFTFYVTQGFLLVILPPVFFVEYSSVEVFCFPPVDLRSVRSVFFFATLVRAGKLLLSI